MKIDAEFQALIPPLSETERGELEKSLLAEGCRDALVIWDNLLLDGHHRHAICEEHGIDYQTTEAKLPDRVAAKEWIIRNQFGRRNLQPFQRAELALKLEPLLAEKAKANQRAGGQHKEVGRQMSDKPLDTKMELAKAAGVSHDTIAKAKKISEKAPEAVKEKLRRGETSINREYQKLATDEKRTELRAEWKSKGEPTAAPEPGKYRCIVIDPPWPMAKIEREDRPQQGDALDYPVMTLENIGGIPVGEWAHAEGCHVYLWTTHKFLPDALAIFTHWGAKYQCLLTWVKNVGMTPFSWMYSTEHILFGRIGGDPGFLKLGERLDFAAKVREHSRKPDAFYELVARVSPGPRLDAFSREARDGFDQYGNEPGRFDD